LPRLLYLLTVSFLPRQLQPSAVWSPMLRVSWFGRWRVRSCVQNPSSSVSVTSNHNQSRDWFRKLDLHVQRSSVQSVRSKVHHTFIRTIFFTESRRRSRKRDSTMQMCMADVNSIYFGVYLLTVLLNTINKLRATFTAQKVFSVFFCYVKFLPVVALSACRILTFCYVLLRRIFLILWFYIVRFFSLCVYFLSQFQSKTWRRYYT